MPGLDLLEREVFAGLPGAAPLVWMLPQHERTAGLAGLQIIALEQLSCAETLLQVDWDLHTHRLAFLCLSPPPEAVRPQSGQGDGRGGSSLSLVTSLRVPSSGHRASSRTNAVPAKEGREGVKSPHSPRRRDVVVVCHPWMSPVTKASWPVVAAS